MFLEIIIALLISSISIAAILPIFERSLNFSNKINWSSILNIPKCETISRRGSYNFEKCQSDESKEPTFNITRSNSGFGLLELIFSISLGIILLASLNKVYAIISIHSKNLKIEIQDNFTNGRILSEISRLFKISDTHPFAIYPRIHSKGQIFLANGKINEVVHGNTKLRPSIQSDAITNNKIVMSLLSDIKNCSASGNQRFGKACLRYSNSASTSDYQSFIMISLDGIYEGQGSFKGLGQCKDFTINLGESMLLGDPPSTDVCNERLLIPLEFIQTIYQSQTGDFRLLTHRNNSNVENQPLTNLKPQLHLLLNFNLNFDPWNIDIQINKEIKNLLSQKITSRLGRQDTTNFLFNNL